MKDEIKEILDGFKEVLDNPTTSDECYDGRVIVIDRSYDLDLDEIKLLLDYITNLQEENEKLLKKSYSDDARITKAIEYIKKNKIKISIKRNSEYAIPIEEIENILQGKSDE